MARRIHDRVMLGIIVVVILTAIVVATASAGLLGLWAESIASQTWAKANTAAQAWFASFETFGKLAAVVITLLSGAYAIYQRYYFAEFNMHTRLHEFQQRFEARLRDSNKHIGNAVLRPSPARKFESPIFTDETLTPVLKKMKWGKRPKADKSLESELEMLEKQLGLWDGQKREYEQRKAQACLLKGAMAAARAAKKDGEEARKDNLEALKYFRTAFELSKGEDVEALEYVGHQQVRLANHDAALESFEELASIALKAGASLLRARALKFQAEVYEFREPPNVYQANLILKEAVSALPADASHLERAEIHEVHGRVRKKCGHQNAATDSYAEAQFWYQRIVKEGNSNDEHLLVAKTGYQRVSDEVHRIRLGLLTPGANDIGTKAPEPPPPNATQEAM